MHVLSSFQGDLEFISVRVAFVNSQYEHRDHQEFIDSFFLFTEPSTLGSVKGPSFVCLFICLFDGQSGQ